MHSGDWEKVPQNHVFSITVHTFYLCKQLFSLYPRIVRERIYRVVLTLRHDPVSAFLLSVSYEKRSNLLAVGLVALCGYRIVELFSLSLGLESRPALVTLK